MIEVQVYEGTENSHRYLLPGQVADYGRNLMAFAKRVAVMGAKMRDPTIKRDLTRYSGHMMAVGLTVRKEVWNEADMNNLPLILGQVAGYAIRHGFSDVSAESAVLLSAHSIIADIKRNG